MTRKEKQVVANLMYRMCTMNGGEMNWIRGNMYGCEEVKDVLALLNDADKKEYAPGKKSERWASDWWHRFVGKKLIEEHRIRRGI